MADSLRVDVGDGAQMAAPRPGEDGTGLSWRLRWSAPGRSELIVAAEIHDSYAYLLSNEITANEAIRRLRIMRRAFHAAFHGATP